MVTPSRQRCTAALTVFHTLGVRSAFRGRRTVKYRGISPREDRYLIRIDPGIDFVVKLEAVDGSTVEVVNIQEEPQPAQLFEIPAGYLKFDPQKLIDRIKQSDVWVELTP